MDPFLGYIYFISTYCFSGCKYVSSFSATVPGSVFEGKTPIVPEADAPTDNEAYIRLLREEYADFIAGLLERAENGG